MRAHIVIVGGNFAGLKAALSLSRSHRVTVIDPTRSFEWLPNIHELVSGVKKASDLRLARRRVLAASGHRFVRAGAASIDAGAGQVHLEDGKALPFDACIAAVGGVHATFGVRGADRHALPFKSVTQCEAIGRKLRQLTRGRAPVSVAIVGGGLEGIEALGEILRRHRAREHFSVTLIEAAPRLLPNAPSGLDELIRGHCSDLPVTLKTGARVRSVRAGDLVLDDGTQLDFDLCIWSAGATAPPLLHESGLAPAARAWAPVRADLTSTVAGSVFVVGDAAAFPEPLSKQAYHALQMGEHAALNADRLLRGRALLPFQPAPKPAIITFGDLDTFFVRGDTALAGTGLAAVKEGVFQVTMAQLDPPTSSSALSSLADRLGHGIASIFPALAPERLLRLPRVRLV